jgi:SAM-dependent methyltransferase
MRFVRRRNSSTEPEGSSEVASAAAPGRRRGLRRIASAILLVGVLAALARPGQRLARALARWIDRHVEGFTEPGSRAYVRFFSPVFGRIFPRVAEDVARELESHGPTRKATIVDVGCGPGDLVVAISQRLRDARIVGIDRSPSMLLWAGRHATSDGRIKFVVADSADLPFDDLSVDLVVSTLSMHHWAAPADSLFEIARILRPGAVGLIYDLGLLALTPAEMETIAEQAGLEPGQIVRERAHVGLLSGLFVRYRLEAPATDQAGADRSR